MLRIASDNNRIPVECTLDSVKITNNCIRIASG